MKVSHELQSGNLIVSPETEIDAAYLINCPHLVNRIRGGRRVRMLALYLWTDGDTVDRPEDLHLTTEPPETW